MAIATQESISSKANTSVTSLRTAAPASNSRWAMLINWRPLAECWLSCPSGTG
jgi:hypothetical protein